MVARGAISPSTAVTATPVEAREPGTIAAHGRCFCSASPRFRSAQPTLEICSDLAQTAIGGKEKLPLNHLKALVTGASAVGPAIALRLAEDGAEVIVRGRDAETVRQIKAAGGLARFIAADLTDAATTLRRLAQEAGVVDIFVNNAGLALFGPPAGMTVEQFDTLFAGNVRATFILFGALAPGMVARHSGSIINIGSMVRRAGPRGSSGVWRHQGRDLLDDARVAAELDEVHFLLAQAEQLSPRIPR